ncbi:VWA domain-containing protein [Silvibacterium sp.]|uniref:VWA domain-containing protein n=1 Tax=Silvibacterium sp. TaxID=1964179 RepID=UPI0039E4CD14
MATPLPYAQDAKPATSATSTASQSPASQSPASQASAPTTLHVDVNVVSMAVTVRDKHGKIVPNLTKDDFTLQDDNHPQTIKYFNQDQNLPLTLGLLVDTSMSLRDALSDERTASQHFLDQMLTQSKDRAFLVQFDREVDLLADPTSNRDTLQRALDHLAAPQFDRSSNSGSGSNDPNSNDPDQNSGDNNSNNRGRRMSNGGTMLYDAIYLASDELMAKEKGRKALIVLTDGEDRGSKETLHTAIEAAQRADTVVYAMYFKGEQHNNSGGGPGGGHRGGGMGWPGGGGGWPGGGGGYPGGGGGGYPGGGGGGQRQEKPAVDGKKVLEQICAETGGRMFEVKKKENFDDIYSQIAEELRSQYVLGYTPDKTVAGGGYHRITLLPKKKDLIVQTRQGYYSQD